MSDLEDSGSNQRWSFRVPYAAQLVVVRDGDAWLIELQDISEGGCGVFRPDDCNLEIGDLVRLYFLEAPGRAVGVDARVARDDQRSLGFEYLEPQSVPPVQADRSEPSAAVEPCP